MKCSIACAGPLVALALLARPVLAQAPSAPATAAAPVRLLSEALQGSAKQAYESAKLLATNGDFAGALAEFRHAYTLSKDPRLLFNMAICDRELRWYARMRATLEQYLQEGVNIATPESLVAAQDALTAIKPLVAVIKIDVSEAGAEVMVDGEPVGTTPIATAVPVDLGKHQVAVTKSGFDLFEQTVETPGGTEAVIAVSLKATNHAAQLVVEAEGDAIVVVDGRTAARGRFDGSMAPGAHDLAVSAVGKRPYKVHLDLRDGETRTLQITLEEEPHGGSAWPWILGGAAVVAGAAVGGYVLLKPHDPSPAPVPAGRFGSVQLTVWRR